MDRLVHSREHLKNFKNLFQKLESCFLEFIFYKTKSVANRVQFLRYFFSELEPETGV